MHPVTAPKYAIRMFIVSRFGSNPLDFFNSVYQDVAPWDIGTPQPAMVSLIERYPPINPILDLGVVLVTSQFTWHNSDIKSSELILSNLPLQLRKINLIPFLQKLHKY
jgi:hypothetical protein